MVVPGSASELYIGTAGWSIPAADSQEFPGEGTHLARYARRFRCCEINSTFHRPHRTSTFERWAATVPPDFRFSVKLPKAITHTARLQESDELVNRFLDDLTRLGQTLGCLLVQLPPSLQFDQAVAEGFLSSVRDRYSGPLVCEPRHGTWLAADADRLLRRYQVARVAADPDRPSGAAEAGGWDEIVYFRLHGSPRMYYSSYSDDFLGELAEKLASAGSSASQVWCIFDNTTQGAATRNALDLMRRARAPERI